jgi:hypothetical protein
MIVLRPTAAPTGRHRLTWLPGAGLFPGRCGAGRHRVSDAFGLTSWRYRTSTFSPPCYSYLW